MIWLSNEILMQNIALFYIRIQSIIVFLFVWNFGDAYEFFSLFEFIKTLSKFLKNE